MVQPSDESKVAAVYVAFKSLLTSIEILEQGLPSKIDTSVWPTMAGGVRAQLISALKFLGLIDNDRNPQPDLERLVNDKEHRPETLKGVLERSYPTIVQLGSTNASSKQLEDEMRAYNVAGDTLEKAIRFYLQAAEYAGIPLSPHWKKRKAPARISPDRKKPKAPKRSTEVTPLVRQPMHEQNMMIVELPSGGQMRLSVTADMMKMSIEERTFMFDVIDKMHAFEQEHKKASKGGDA